MAYDCGITSYKFYMAYTQDEASVFGILAVDDAQFLAGLRQVAAIGKPAIAMVHAENMSIIHNLKAKYIAAGRDDLKAWTDARPDIAEEEATRRAIWYTRETGSQLYIVHMTIGRGVDWVRQAKAEGVDVIAETCPHYLVLTKYDNDKVGSLAKVNPPLRDAESQEKPWEGLRDSTETCVGSDHSTVVAKPDKVNTSIWDAVPGFPGMGMLLPVMLSEGYHKGRISLPDVSRILGLQNGRGMGALPQEGCPPGRLRRRLRHRRPRSGAGGNARVHAVGGQLGPVRRVEPEGVADSDHRERHRRHGLRRDRRRPIVWSVHPEVSVRQDKLVV